MKNNLIWIGGFIGLFLLVAGIRTSKSIIVSASGGSSTSTDFSAIYFPLALDTPPFNTAVICSQNPSTSTICEGGFIRFGSTSTGILTISAPIVGEMSFQSILGYTFNFGDANSFSANSSNFTVNFEDGPGNFVVNSAGGLIQLYGTTEIHSGGSAGKVTCYKADGYTLGYCSSIVGVGGGCTCN